ncbi:unnamed protein product, partial [Arabidopsis halleri]
RSRRRPCWQNKFVIYDIVMSLVLIVFNVATLSYIRSYKIHIVDPHGFHLIKGFSIFYCVTFIYGVALSFMGLHLHLFFLSHFSLSVYLLCYAL